jgi:recombinational DNA repair protein (RecF pathway)
MALVTTNAIVLKSMRWGEADRILTFFLFDSARFEALHAARAG